MLYGDMPDSRHHRAADARSDGDPAPTPAALMPDGIVPARQVVRIDPVAQTRIGLTLAALILGGWIVAHAYAMFGFRFTAANWPLGVGLGLILTWLSVGMFIVAHDAMHGALAPRARHLETPVGTLALGLYAGFDFRLMRRAHYDHHRFAGTAADPDFHDGNPRDFWPWYVHFLREYFGWRSALFITLVVQLYFWVLDVPLVNILALYAAPAIISSLQLFAFGTWAPHRHDRPGHAPLGRVMHPPFPDRHNARTNRMPSWMSLLTCFHFGYHHEHHLAPQLPWWALPRQHRLYLEGHRA